MADDQPVPKLAFSIREFASAVGISESTAWKEVRVGELETGTVGDRRIVTTPQIETWLRRKAEAARRRREARAT